MRVFVQKVIAASVTVDDQKIASITHGFLVYVGVAAGDTDAECDAAARKVAGLRLFSGEDGKINDRSLQQVQGAVLVVSQFTLLGSVAGGNRPDYTAAAPRAEAQRLYERFIEQLRENGVMDVQAGRFGAHMVVESMNDGPVTLCIGFGDSVVH